MVDGINSTSTYVPNMSNVTSPDSYAGYTSNYSYPNDSVEFSTQQQQQDKSKRNKLIGLAAGALALVGVVAFRKNIPLIGKYFEEGGGGIKKAAEEGLEAVKNIGKKGEPLQSVSDLNNNLKAAEKNLANLQKKGALNVDIKEAKNAVKAAEEALVQRKASHVNDIYNAALALKKGRASGMKGDDLKSLEKALEDAKGEYSTALTGSGIKADDVTVTMNNSMRDVYSRLDKESASKTGLANKFKALLGKDPAVKTVADSKEVQKLGTARKNWLISNGIEKGEAEKQVTEEMRNVVKELNEAKAKAAGTIQ